MLDHISLRVQDFARAREFYKAALAPLGYEVVMEFPDSIGMGDGGKIDFWLNRSDQPINPTHIAFSTAREKVEAFHEAALAAGGTDNGPPGSRPEYHPNYFGAFVRDPEGNNIEAVCHADPARVARKAAIAAKVVAAAAAKAKSKGAVSRSPAKSKAVKKPLVAKKAPGSKAKPAKAKGRGKSRR
jgi:catechol 2,3-dioxygenase-like lactoylglutathione lyase family enzyme